MKQLEGKIAAGHVLVARAFSPCADATGARPSPLPSPGIPGEGERVGYVISRDQYFKRDDVGIIYQLNVLPSHQRGLIGAHLLKAVFDRAAYGCRLFCCWCAQDIAANRFWEAMGFVPLAFRSGGRARRHAGTKAHRHEGDSVEPGLPSVPSCLRASGQSPYLLAEANP
jgi:GNAT superfamily N-acetyltransferase